jgi:hypothetical protein
MRVKLGMGALYAPRKESPETPEERRKRLAAIAQAQSRMSASDKHFLY